MKDKNTKIREENSSSDLNSPNSQNETLPISNNNENRSQTERETLALKVSTHKNIFIIFYLSFNTNYMFNFIPFCNIQRFKKYS